MVFRIPSFKEALRKMGLGDRAPKETPADVTNESAAPERTRVLGEDINPWTGSPASANGDMPLPDDEATKTVSAKGLKESWGGAYRNSMTDGVSKPGAPSRAESSPSESRPVSGAQDIPVEDLSVGIINALSDGLGSVLKTTSSVGAVVATEAELRVEAIRSESASEFGALRMFITELVCGTKDERRNDG